MSKHDEARRAFLVGAATIGAGARDRRDACARPQPSPSNSSRRRPTWRRPRHHDHGRGYGTWLNVDESAALAAFTERLMPGAPGMPGATDAGVLNYIDLALAGAYADQRDFYRRGLAQLDAYCRKAHNEAFAKLPAAQQDEVITALEQGKAEGFTWPSGQAFFNTVRTHTIEGMFADPVYGGNKDFAGWRLVGFPGAHPAFSPADMQSKEAFAGGSAHRPAGASPQAEGLSHGNRKNGCCHRRRRRGRRHPRRRARQGRHEGDRARAWPAPQDRGLRPAGRAALLPAPGSAPRRQAPAGHLAAERERAGDADRNPELRQPGRRRHRPLRRGVVALPRGRFPGALADDRALWRVRDPGGFLGDRLAGELSPSSSPTTIAPSTSSACRARPATCRAARSRAATCSRRRASANFRCRR